MVHVGQRALRVKFVHKENAKSLACKGQQTARDLVLTCKVIDPTAEHVGRFALLVRFVQRGNVLSLA